MAAIWQSTGNTTWGNFQAHQFSLFFISTEEPELPDIALFMQFIPGQAHNYDLANKVHIHGSFNQLFTGTSAVPAVQVIALERSVHRRIHSRIFGRIN